MIHAPLFDCLNGWMVETGALAAAADRAVARVDSEVKAAIRKQVPAAAAAEARALLENDNRMQRVVKDSTAVMQRRLTQAADVSVLL